MTLDETTFLNGARAADQEAFAQLIEPYRKQLLVHCYRILGSLEDGEDMLQETLVRVWKRLDSFEGRSSLRAWIYKVVSNASLDALDSRRALTSKRAIRAQRPNPAAAITITGSELGGTPSRRMDRWSTGYLSRSTL